MRASFHSSTWHFIQLCFVHRCSVLQFERMNLFICFHIFWKLDNLWQVFNFPLSETTIRTHVRIETTLLSKWASKRYDSYTNALNCLLFNRSESCDGNTHQGRPCLLMIELPLTPQSLSKIVSVANLVVFATKSYVCIYRLLLSRGQKSM